MDQRLGSYLLSRKSTCRELSPGDPSYMSLSNIHVICQPTATALPALFYLVYPSFISYLPGNCIVFTWVNISRTSSEFCSHDCHKQSGLNMSFFQELLLLPTISWTRPSIHLVGIGGITTCNLISGKSLSYWLNWWYVQYDYISATYSCIIWQATRLIRIDRIISLSLSSKTTEKGHHVL